MPLANPGRLSREMSGEDSVSRPALGLRKNKILEAASDLFHRRGFHSVGMDEIGEAVGVTGPAIYSHFPSKTSLLVAIMERTADELIDFDRIVSEAADPADALRRLVAHQVDFALSNRSLISIWIRETRSLPAADQQRLRQRQRYYVGRWVDKVLEIHPEMDPAEALSVVQGVFNLIGSVAFYEPKLGREALRSLLERKAITLLLQS